MNPGDAVPFARAWPSALTAHAIAKEDFIAFIDNLNVIILPHVVFRVLQVAGFAVGLVPYDVAEGVGGALEAIATIGGMAAGRKLQAHKGLNGANERKVLSSAPVTRQGH